MKRRYQRESDAGDVAKKVMQGLGSIHKIGGVGLDLIAIGFVILLFSLIFQSTLSGLAFGIFLIISIGLIVVGALILLKEKGLIGDKNH